MVFSGDKEEKNGIWVAELLLLFRNIVTENNTNQEYASLQYIQATYVINAVEKTVCFACSRLSTDSRVHHQLRGCTGSLEGKSSNRTEEISYREIENSARLYERA